MHRRLLLPVALAALSCLAASCGGSPSAVDDVASLGTDAPDATDATDAAGDTSDGDAAETTIDPEDAMVAFARCMREHGIDVPDPQTAGGQGGGVMIEVGDDIDRDEMAAAQEACEPLMEDAVGSFEPPDPEEVERMQEQMLEFSQCMREHGVDMPDPVFSGDGVTVEITGGAESDADPDEMREAQEACQDELGAGVPFAISVESGAPVASSGEGEGEEP
ncbi:MAG: hypothetical protein AB7Q42_11810 [Acidimicrobiia bacterium]